MPSGDTEHPMNEDDIRIRCMRSYDIPDGMRLKTAAGWNQTERDWELFLAASPNECFVAECDGIVAGSVATITYENRLAWIGMMLVDPAYRRRGIATRLMNRAVEQLGNDITIKLDATPLGKTVYDRLGFVEEYTISRMVAESCAVDGSSATGVTPVTPADLGGLNALDSKAFGAVRDVVLNALFRNSPGLAWKCCGDGRLTGYCLGRPGSAFLQIGPIIAGRTDDAVGLTEAALSGMTGGTVVIDVPVHRKYFLRWLSSCGFREQRLLIRMYRGSNNCPGRPELVFAITGPEFG